MSANLDNVLLLALANDELDKFLVGEPFYFQEAKNDNEEPQNIVAAFDLLVLRYWQQTRDPQFPGRFVAALLKILATYPDRNRAIYVAAVWVWYYRFCLSKSRHNPRGFMPTCSRSIWAPWRWPFSSSLSSTRLSLFRTRGGRAAPGTARTACGGL